jgi:3-phosphoshikimate 1-carboxyvinyltransferase
MNLKNSHYNIEKINSFRKKIEIPSSKSYANRALILGALVGNSFKISNVPNSSDVQNLLICLKKIGLNVIENNDEVFFLNSFPSCELDTDEKIILATGDGGTTNRFLMALLALGKNTYELIPSEKMSERPMTELADALRELDVQIISNNNSWYEIKGPMNLNEKKIIDVDCSRSTQFASALKLVLFNQKIKINLKNVKSSEDYIHMTEKVIHDASKNRGLRIPVDFSSAGYPLALAALIGEVEISNCHFIDDFQADSVLLDILEESGALVDINENGLLVKNNGRLKAFKVDGADCPDLIMTLAFIASYADGTSELRGVNCLRYKESDRLVGILNLLNEFKITHSYDVDLDMIKITGGQFLNDKKNILPERDHRMVMISYLYLKINGGGELYNIDCVEKSFPDFLKVME